MRVISVIADGPVSDIAAARGFYTHHLGPSDEEFNLESVARYPSPNMGARRFDSLLSRVPAATEPQ